MLPQFQARYPTGSLVSELLSIYQANSLFGFRFKLRCNSLPAWRRKHQNLQKTEENSSTSSYGIDKTRAESAEPEVHTDNISNLAPLHAEV